MPDTPLKICPRCNKCELLPRDLPVTVEHYGCIGAVPLRQMACDECDIGIETAEAHADAARRKQEFIDSVDKFNADKAKEWASMEKKHDAMVFDPVAFLASDTAKAIAAEPPQTLEEMRERAIAETIASKRWWKVYERFTNETQQVPSFVIDQYYLKNTKRFKIRILVGADLALIDYYAKLAEVVLRMGDLIHRIEQSTKPVDWMRFDDVFVFTTTELADRLAVAQQQFERVNHFHDHVNKGKDVSFLWS